MRRSMRTTSSSNSAASATAWSPSAAAPTTSIRGSRPGSIVKPSRTTRWSSAISTQIGALMPAPAAAGVPGHALLALFARCQEAVLAQASGLVAPGRATTSAGSGDEGRRPRAAPEQPNQTAAGWRLTAAGGTGPRRGRRRRGPPGGDPGAARCTAPPRGWRSAGAGTPCPGAGLGDGALGVMPTQRPPAITASQSSMSRGVLHCRCLALVAAGCWACYILLNRVIGRRHPRFLRPIAGSLPSRMASSGCRDAQAGQRPTRWAERRPQCRRRVDPNAGCRVDPAGPTPRQRDSPHVHPADQPGRQPLTRPRPSGSAGVSTGDQP